MHYQQTYGVHMLAYTLTVLCLCRNVSVCDKHLVYILAKCKKLPKRWHFVVVNYILFTQQKTRPLPAKATKSFRLFATYIRKNIHTQTPRTRHTHLRKWRQKQTVGKHMLLSAQALSALQC